MSASVLTNFGWQISELLAHAGHGTGTSAGPESVLHYLTEPQHAWAFAGVVGVAAAILIARRWMPDSDSATQADR